MEEKITMATKNVFESFCGLDRDFFLLSNFIRNISKIVSLATIHCLHGNHGHDNYETMKMIQVFMFTEYFGHIYSIVDILTMFIL